MTQTMQTQLVVIAVYDETYCSAVVYVSFINDPTIEQKLRREFHFDVNAIDAPSRLRPEQLNIVSI